MCRQFRCPGVVAAQTQSWLRRTQEKLETANRAAKEAEEHAANANRLALEADELADAARQRRELADEATHRAETLPDTIKVSVFYCVITQSVLHRVTG